MRVTPEIKLGALSVAAAIMVTVTRITVTKGWRDQDSFMHLVIGFIIHLLAVYLLFVITGATIMRFHKFFIGHEDENLKRGDYRQLEYFFFMTVFLAASAIFILYFWPTSGDDDPG
jgi:mannose/fructose/N-acetylgalactosamine-specific phosphotransferase system component IIC